MLKRLSRAAGWMCTFIALCLSTLTFSAHAQQPAIAGFTPAIGASGTAVTITGQNFAPSPGDNIVEFNGRLATVNSADMANIVVPVPAVATSGKIAVRTPSGTALSSADFFVPPSPYSAADIQITDRMSIGQSKSIAISEGGKKALILFEGTAGQRISMAQTYTMHSSSRTIIRNPDGTIFYSGYVHSFMDVQALPASGTYTIFIDPFASSTGSVTLQLYEVPPDVAGTIVIGGPAVTVTTTTPGQNASLTFEGTAGQRISMRQTTTMSPSNSTTIRAPDGTVLYTGPVTGFMDVQMLPVSGTYTIIIDGKTDIGSVTLQLYDVHDVTGSITIGGPAVTVALEMPGQNASLTFEGTAGQRISMNRSHTMIGYAVSATIRNPDGTDFYFSFRIYNFIDVQTLPFTGTYTIFIDPAGSSTGSVTVQLYDVPPDVTGAITVGGPAATVNVTTPGQNASLTFEGMAGQRVSMTQSSTVSGISNETTIRNPDGTVFYSGDVSSFMDVRVLPASGTYTIVINPYQANTGSVTLRLYEVTDVTGTIAIGDPAVTVNVTTPGQNAQLTFDAITGQQVTVQILNKQTGATAFSLLNPAGTVLASSSSSATNFSLPLQTLAESGTYTITINPSGAKIGSVGIRVTTPDVTPPTIGEMTANGQPVGSTLSITGDTIFVFSATDASGIRSAQAALGDRIQTVTSTASGYQFTINPGSIPNGEYSLVVQVTDNSGNVAQKTVAVTVAIPAPAAPAISQPLDQSRTNKAAQLVRGTAASGTEVQVYINDVAAGAWVQVTAGIFEVPVTLTEGANILTAEARSIHGTSTRSAAIVVTFDTAVPASISNLTATAQPGGKIRLAWNRSSDPSVVGVHIYRATAGFETTEGMARVNPAGLTGTTYDDLPAQDGIYHYRVVSVNSFGAESVLSNMVRATADSKAPHASIAYAPLGKVDAATGRVGQGTVNVVLTVTEPLQAPPYLAIVPNGRAPITISLTKQDDTRYSGSFAIDTTTGSGVANALFSARDTVGNRGTEIDAGATLQIDAEGPAVTDIVIAPVSPIKNDTAQTVTATFTLSKPMKPGEIPQLRYLLSGPVRSATVIAGVTAIDALTWRGVFTLPADAGAGSPETLSFAFRGIDDLDNVSTKIATPNNRFQVYQGSLPPLAIPLGLKAEAQPAGKARLTWQAVEHASAYQLYRQGPGDTALLPLQRTTGAEYIDATPQDGRYQYAVATVRQSNGEEAISGQTAPVEVVTSSNAPGAPQNLNLVLVGAGIQATWQPPLNSTVASYKLYRSSAATIGTVDGLTPVKSGIQQTSALDANPSPTDHAYVVTALDAAGNESAISNSAYLNFNLLPVPTLKAEQLGDDLPQVTWAASKSANAGYNVYIEAEDSKIKLTATPTSDLTFQDTGYNGGERRYTVAVVDSNGVEMPRTITMPNLTMDVVSGMPIKRGVMNRLQVQVANTSPTGFANAKAVIRINNIDHKSDAFALGANETRMIPVIVGGYAELQANAAMQVGVEIVPNEGELVKGARSTAADIADGSLVVGLATEEFTRGGTGKVRLTIENTSEVEVELLTARNHGTDESDELRFKILDGDGNVLATQPYKQVSGANVITPATGQTVVTIAAGASYVSDVFSLNVPAAAPNSVRIKLEVDKLRYRTGQPDAVIITGRGSEKIVSLMDTAYLGEVTDVNPISSYGDQDVIITGRALERQSMTPLPNTRLKLVLNQQGFERLFSVITDAAGNFTYSFKPTITDAGLYKVSAVHPEITDRPEQKAFTINRVTVGPSIYSLDVPKNYPFSIPLQAKAGAGTAATNLRLTLDAASQPTGQIPAGIELNLPAPVNLTEKQTLNVPVLFTANNDAQPSGSLILNVISDEHAATPLGQVKVNYKLSEAKPFLSSTPGFVQTGLAQGGSQIESVTIENKGLQDALNLQFALAMPDGSTAPSWISLTSQINGTLAIGAKRLVDIAFNPPSGIAEDVYEYRLVVQGDNVPAQSVNVYASVTQSGQGNVLFKAADIYTATIGNDGKLIAGLAGATITVQNEDVTTISHSLVTDSMGEALFENLPAGHYKFRATAANHQEIGGRLQVKPGITFNQPVFLEYNLITVEWSVREITLQDRYEITLNATYETDVPAAVVLLQPSSVNLPLMNPGDVFYGELTLTNFGLVRAQNVKQTLPRNDAFFRFEFLVDVPTALEPKQRVTLPYRVISLQSLEGSISGAASGGGCYAWGNSTRVTCESVCANGTVSVNCGSSTSWFANGGTSGDTCTGGTGGGSSGLGPWPRGTAIPMKQKCSYLPNGGGLQCSVQ